MKIPLDYISFYDSIEKIDFFDEWSILDSLKSIVESEDDFYKNIITERKFFSHFICDGLLKTNYRFTLVIRNQSTRSRFLWRAWRFIYGY